MGPIVWFIAAGVLAIAELAAMDFSLLMLALAALATAGVAVADVPLWAEAATFAVAGVLSLFLLRPVLRKRLKRGESHHTFSPKELEGSPATVVDAITSGGHAQGMVRINGELWSARALNPMETFQSGDTVQVAHIDGTTAVVWKGI